MRAVVAGSIRFRAKECPPKLLELLRRELSFPNPECVSLKRMKRFRGQVPETIECLIERKDGGVEIPRGAVGILRTHARENGVELCFVDERQAFPRIDVEASIRLRPYQEKAVAAMRTGFQGSVVVPCGGGKCVSRDTLFFTDKGLLTGGELARGVPVKGTAEGDIGVDTSVGTARSNAIYNGGQTDTRRIRLSLGYDIETTPEHPLKVLKDGELVWKRADELNLGDRVMVRLGSDVWNGSPEVYATGLPLHALAAEVAGLLVGCGDVGASPGIHFSTANPSVVHTLSRWLDSFGADSLIDDTDPNRYIVHSALARDFLNWLGLTWNTTGDARIPKRIRQSNREVMRCFLRGLFDGAAEIDVKRGVIVLPSPAKQLLKELQVALLGFGLISCRYRWRGPDGDQSWRLSIHDIEGFSREIGSALLDRQNKLASLLPAARTRPDILNIDTLPAKALLEALRDAATKSCLWNKRAEKIFHKYIVRGRVPSRFSLEILVKWFDGHCAAECEPIRRLLGLPAVFLPVVHIQKSTASVIDLYVPGHHEFVGNGVVCHNTVIGAAAIAEIRQPSLVLVHTRDLVDQWVDAIKAILKIDPGVVSAGCNTHEKITIATVQSLIRQPGFDAICSSYGTVIVDESQHAPAITFQKILSRVPAKFRFGLTATPYREDGLTRLIHLTLGERLYEVKHRKLIEEGYLKQPEIQVVQTDFNFEYGDTYNHNRCMKALVDDPARNQLILDLTQKQADAGNTVLVLSNRIEHCRHLAHQLRERGVPAEALVGPLGKTKRRQVLTAFKAGELAVVTATTLADEGLDVPRLNRIVLGFPGRAKGRTVQRLGRIMRPYPNKQRAVLYDLVDHLVSPLLRQYRERRRLYKTLGFHFSPLNPKQIALPDGDCYANRAVR